MKKLIQAALSMLLVSAIQVNAFEVSNSISQMSAVPNTFQRIQTEKFKAPYEGTYTVSFDANAYSQTRPTDVTIKAFVNGQAVDSVSATAQVPRQQATLLNFNGTLNLHENDVVDFRFKSTADSAELRPVNTAPSFTATINAEKPSVKL